MFKLYTPKEWNTLFDSPSLIIDDDGKIWTADNYYKIISGEPSGRIDYAAGKIYGKDMGYGMFAEPIAYLETKNDVIQVIDAGKGLFSSPILYIRDDKVYTPEEYYSIISNPSGYIRREDRTSGGGSSGSVPYSGGTGRNTTSSRTTYSGGGGGGNFSGVIAIVFLLLLPAIWINITWVGLALSVAYLIFVGILVIRKGVSVTKRNVLRGLGAGFLTFVVVYLVLFLVTNFGRGTINHELSGWNELAGWIAGAGTFLGCLEKNDRGK